MALKININCIETQVDAENADDAIRAAGKVLLKNGYIEERYIDAMLENFKKNGAYFVIAPNFAMPHARPEDGVHKPGVSIITLKKPVNFNTENDPVKVVLALATGTNEEHLNYIMTIADVLGRDNIIESIYNAENSEDIVKLFS